VAVIHDYCPVCNTRYVWDACHDTYPGLVEEEGVVAGRGITLFLCPADSGVVAVSVTDDAFGSQVYVPSEDEV
jgi:hypothetical protein